MGRVMRLQAEEQDGSERRNLAAAPDTCSNQHINQAVHKQQQYCKPKAATSYRHWHAHREVMLPHLLQVVVQAHDTQLRGHHNHNLHGRQEADGHPVT